jgi:hypothetical protein
MKYEVYAIVLTDFFVFRYFAMEDLTPEMEKFMQQENIEILHYRTEGNKEPFLEISTEDINHALVKLLDERSHPGTPFNVNDNDITCHSILISILVLIHCLKGKVTTINHGLVQYDHQIDSTISIA